MRVRLCGSQSVETGVTELTCLGKKDRMEMGGKLALALKVQSLFRINDASVLLQIICCISI
jgi:hypothetical protein